MFATTVTAKVSSKSQEMLSSAYCKNVQLLAILFLFKGDYYHFFSLGYLFTVAYYHYKVYNGLAFPYCVHIGKGMFQTAH